MDPAPDIGRRIHVVGSTCAGKSSLAEALARHLGVPHVDPDALNWEPGWHSVAEHDPEEFRRRLAQATAGDGWVVAGDYSRFTRPLLGPRLQTIVWLDLPLRLILWRVLSRSWRRWRRRELLWGTNYENFWSHLALWRGKESLLWWAITTFRGKRRRYLAAMQDPEWAHVRFVHLRSVREVDAFAEAVRRAGASPAAASS